MTDRWIATAVATLAAVWSMARYARVNSTYDTTRPRLSADGSFKWVFKCLVAGAFGATIASYWTQQYWLMDVHDQPAWRLIGSAVMLLGVAGFEMSVRALGTHYSPCFDARVPAARVTRGPYRLVNHPIYVSNMLILLGAFSSSGSLWVLLAAVIIGVYYVRAARVESAAFGGPSR